MDDILYDKEYLIGRVKQLEHERDELQKDIEQLCIQQAGSSYLVAATRLHFQRTAALEQEIDILKKKLAACIRDNSNLQEELSEAYSIKSQFADLHAAELSKNIEAEKQVKFFQGCVGAAFAERDQAMMEALKAKEKEELLEHQLNNLPKRVAELTSECLEQKRLNDELQADLAKEEEQNIICRKVIDKFYEIKQYAEGLEDEDPPFEDKCASLLRDPDDMWSFSNERETSTSQYISVLEEELEKVRKSVDTLQHKLHVGLEIENHLKKRVSGLEKKNILYHITIKSKLSELAQFQSRNKLHVLNILGEEKNHLKAIVDTVEEKFRQLDRRRKQNLAAPQSQMNADYNECRDVHISNDSESNLEGEPNDPCFQDVPVDRRLDTSKALAQAMQEKVSALLLLSQEEERQLLESNVNAALQKKIDEIQRNLQQVTNEKVKALVELARLKQQNHILHEKLRDEMGQGKQLAITGEKKAVINERDGRLKNMLKKTYLKKWIGALDSSGYDTEAHSSEDTRRSNTGIDIARLKIENATFKESMESMDHLTSSIHSMRDSLLKAKELAMSEEGTIITISNALEEIISDAKLIKTALGSSLPISWSAEVDIDSSSESIQFEPVSFPRNHQPDKIDSVCAAGFEMVELIIIAAQALKETASNRG